MSRSLRLAALEAKVAGMPPDPGALRSAFGRFRRTGVLPEDEAMAVRVVVWADTGVDPTRFELESDLGREGLLRAYVAGLMAREDPTMEGLRSEAVYAEEPVQGIARRILVRLAEGGEDPSEPLFRLKGWEPMELTCASVALTWVGFPHCVVAEDRWEEADRVVEELRRVREAVERMRERERESWLRALSIEMEGVSTSPTEPLLALAVCEIRLLAELLGTRAER